jgi:hypothetical protein
MSPTCPNCHAPAGDDNSLRRQYYCQNRTAPCYGLRFVADARGKRLFPADLRKLAHAPQPHLPLAFGHPERRRVVCRDPRPEAGRGITIFHMLAACSSNNRGALPSARHADQGEPGKRVARRHHRLTRAGGRLRRHAEPERTGGGASLAVIQSLLARQGRRSPMTHEQFRSLLTFLRAQKVCPMLEGEGEWTTWHHNLTPADMDEIIAQATDPASVMSGPLEQQGEGECP